MTIDYDQIEEPVRRLVRALNAFEGVTTIGSCGGHENPDEWQEPVGSWFVTFAIAHRGGGWQSLERINLVRSFMECVDIRVYTHGGGARINGRNIFFAMRGDGCSADEAAYWLEQIYGGLTVTEVIADMDAYDVDVIEEFSRL